MDQSLTIREQQISDYRQSGAVWLPGLFADWVEVIRDGIARNMRDPGPYAAENTVRGEPGRFFDDYCNWTRIPELSTVIHDPGVARCAAALMGSRRVQLFHDHVLVKEPGTTRATPWHQDAPYYFVDAEQSISFWIPVDPVSDATLRIIAGSHRWPKFVLPTRWISEENFYADEGDYLPVPDPDRDDSDLDVLEWPMQPGDAVAFHFRSVHGARGNTSTARRRALSLRFVGDDARYVERPGRTSPPFPGHGMQAGDRLREDWFPMLPV